MTQLYNVGSSHPYRDRRRYGVVIGFNASQDKQVCNLEHKETIPERGQAERSLKRWMDVNCTKQPICPLEWNGLLVRTEKRKGVGLSS